ncbi:MAG: LVIVD repeat-containing protein [Flavobacteriaceae bacterium]
MKKFITFSMALLMVLACNNDSDGSSSTGGENGGSDGKGGSLARFALKGDYLYTVDLQNLNVFNVSEKESPVQVNTVHLGFDIETLFGYKEYLYIGSRTGMFIYGLSNPEFPKKMSQVDHFTACDPVVANDTHAYVTLHSTSICGNDLNILEVYDVTDVGNPLLISSRNLISPKGLGLFGDYLIVCDDEIKVFDVSDPKNSKLVNAVDKSAFDIIIDGDLLLAIGQNGLYQYKLRADAQLGIAMETLGEITF